MARLIDDMLVLANADNHTWTIQKSPVELDTLVLDCYEAFRLVAKDHQITLSVVLPNESIPCCHCDKNRIEQILSILLHNAISYGKKDGEILLTLEKEDFTFKIIVADNGIGISDKDKPYVFDRFYRSDTSRNKKEHFGLGLSIAREIVKLHKGSIHLEDTPGGGATFMVLLPITVK